MLCRQYRRFAERRHFELRDIFVREAEHGIKTATLEIRGNQCARLLAGETGIHRLVRISPFSDSPRRHVSFAAVDCFPALSGTDDYNPRDADLKVEIDSGRCGVIEPDTGGPGHPVRITHVPSGIVVESSGRTQTENHDSAMSVLRALVFATLAKTDPANERGESNWGKTLRNYVLTPYELVKDERTKVQTDDVAGVLDGDIDAFVEG